MVIMDKVSGGKQPLSFLIWVLLAISLISVCVGCSGYQEKEANSTKQTDLIKVPAVVGRDLTTARRTAASLGLSVQVKGRIKNTIYPDNFIATQDPLPNEDIKRGKIISVKVSDNKVAAENRPQGPQDLAHTTASTLSKEAKAVPRPLSQKIVVIDPGHQQHADLRLEPIGPGSTRMKAKTQGGTRGIRSGTPEYKVALVISKKLKDLLKSSGFKVIMTRESDNVNLSNIERAEVANRCKADLFVRIHADGSPNNRENGISTLYPAKNKWTEAIYPQSLEAAQIVQEAVVEATKRKDNGVVARSDLTGFNWSKVPVILVEAGFMTNEAEDSLLNDSAYQGLLARGMCEGIVKYFKRSGE